MADTTTVDQQEPSIVTAIKNNDVTLVADISHGDDTIQKAIKSALQKAKTDGNLTDILIEADPKQRTMQDIRGDGEFGKMVSEAERLGIRIHLIDDRSREMERDASYPVESEYVRNNDVYVKDREKLIKDSPNPDRMSKYLDEIKNSDTEEMELRNKKMSENIDSVVKQYPEGKKLAIIGAGHFKQNDDIDEQLRAKGHQAITLEINSPQSSEANMINRGPDLPDFIIKAETGQAASYKDSPNADAMKKIMEGINLPWRNTEPVTNVSESKIGCMPPAHSQGCEKGTSIAK